MLLPYLAPADVNAPAGTGKQTPLHHVAENGGVRVLRMLLTARHSDFDVTAKDAHGRTPRDVALACGHEEVATLLEAAEEQPGYNL